MTDLVIGLLLGAGLFLVWWSCWVPEEARVDAPARRGRVAELGDDIVQAGITGMSPQVLLAAAALLGLVVALTVGAISGAPAVALCFGVMAGSAPVYAVRARARARRRSLRDVWPDVVDNVASGVRAGLSLPEALAQLEEIAHDFMLARIDFAYQARHRAA